MINPDGSRPSIRYYFNLISTGLSVCSSSHLEMLINNREVMLGGNFRCVSYPRLGHHHSNSVCREERIF